MKYAMNMSIITGLLSKVAQNKALTEEETFILQAMYGNVEDKDQTNQDETTKVMIGFNRFVGVPQTMVDIIENYNMETIMMQEVIKYLNKVGKKHTRKMILKDKTKHGFHNGSRKEGWGHYDLWGLPEKSHKDKMDDVKAQMQSLNEEEFTFNADEVKRELTEVFDFQINGFKVVWYHHTADFALLAPWNVKVRSWMEKTLKDMPSEGEVYSYMEDNYPEMSMSDMKNLVEDFLGTWRLSILMEAGSMWRYCKSNNYSYRKELLLDLQKVYNKLDELNTEIRYIKSNDLCIFPGKFSVILAQIESLKMKLEEMNEANAKFI